MRAGVVGCSDRGLAQASGSVRPALEPQQSATVLDHGSHIVRSALVREERLPVTDGRGVVPLGARCPGERDQGRQIVLVEQPSRPREVLEQFDTLHPNFRHPVSAARLAALREALAETPS